MYIGKSRSPLDSLYVHDRCVLLTELLRAHPELLPEAETIAATLLIADNRQIEEEVAGKLRGLRVSALADRIGYQRDEQQAAAGLLAEVIQPYLDDIARRASLGAHTAAVDVGIGVMLGAYDCREETSEDLVLTRAGLPGAADNLARSIYRVLRSNHLSLPALTDECPEWDWYLESWSDYLSGPR